MNTVQEYRNGKPWGKPRKEACKHEERDCIGVSIVDNDWRCKDCGIVWKEKKNK